MNTYPSIVISFTNNIFKGFGWCSRWGRSHNRHSIKVWTPISHLSLFAMIEADSIQQLFYLHFSSVYTVSVQHSVLHMLQYFCHVLSTERGQLYSILWLSAKTHIHTHTLLLWNRELIMTDFVITLCTRNWIKMESSQFSFLEFCLSHFWTNFLFDLVF